MSDLLDNVLKQLDEQPEAEIRPAPAASRPTAPQASADAASADEDPPVIEHDVDLFDEMNSRAVQPTDPGQQPEEEREDLQLITDPRRLSGDSSSTQTGPPSSSGVRSLSGWSGPVSNVKVLEVPMTLDADALEDGKSLRIVLNITVRR